MATSGIIKINISATFKRDSRKYKRLLHYRLNGALARSYGKAAWRRAAIK